MLWLALVACSEPPPPLEEAAACQVRTEGDPYTIDVVADDHEIRATLRNVSAHAQNALHHEVVQPSELVITDASGERVRGTDSRDSKKTALATVSVGYYTPLLSCESLEIGKSSFTKTGSNYAIAWGPYQYQVEPGTYQVAVALPMRIEHYQDPVGRRKRPDGGVWTGDVRSQTVTVVLR